MIVVRKICMAVAINVTIAASVVASTAAFASPSQLGEFEAPSPIGEGLGDWRWD